MQRDLAAGARSVLIRGVARAALATVLIQPACGAGAAQKCRAASAREAVYPFTGTWSFADQTPLCLFQQDPQHVTGEHDGFAAAGIVRQDGELLLSVAGVRGAVTVYSARLSGGDTLEIEMRVAAPAASTGLARRALRDGAGR